MNFTVNEITNSIAGKPSLSECSVDELRQLTSQYPFFGPAQFLFVKKLKEQDSWQLKEQIQKASLYFQNPLWFDHILKFPAAAPTTIAPIAVTVKKEEFISERSSEMEIPVTHEEVVDQTKIITQSESVQADSPTEQYQITHAEFVDHIRVITQPEYIEAETPAEQHQVIHEEIVTAHEKIVDQASTITPPQSVQIESPVEQYHATPEEVVDHTRIITQPEPIEVESPAEQHQPELLIEMPKFKFEPVDVSKTELTFEPYHTIDYFASQGIRPRLEEKPKDQFSRQLKSFTEWLKVMKKLPVTEIAAAISVADEKKVEKMAELSINDREVVTEAMAEVWEKQGNAEKAGEIYEKLSLLNPGKSSYFAAKIEQLKNL